MKIFVIGGGGREHALVWKLRQSPLVRQIWCAPGNGGISEIAECVPVDAGNVAALAELAVQLKPDLTVVGPELPLVRGIADEFTNRGLAIVGPSKAAAELEGSKVFAKQFMERQGIPTATTYGVFDSAVDAYTSLCAVDWPVVLKADGLCAGKGVLVTSSADGATAFIDRVMEKREFGDAGSRLVVEEGLSGQELSYIVLTDGENVLPLASARDHKRALDGDEGPNTGGMGAYSTDSLIPKELEDTIVREIVQPTIRGMAEEGRTYRGFLYFGLMLTQDGPMVLEYNCRMGDPETQAIALRMNFDLAESLAAVAEGNLGKVRLAWHPGASVCIVLASGGYPGRFDTGKPISGLTEAANISGTVVFHAGTRREGPNYYTSGGRVLDVCASGATLSDALRFAYDAASRIGFEGAHYRKDIGVVRAEKGYAVGGEERG
jgi:phosphoribosylamine---glycine ligase